MDLSSSHMKFLKSLSKNNLRVLEVGCSGGQVTEYLQEQSCISKIVSYDVDNEFIDSYLVGDVYRTQDYHIRNGDSSLAPKKERMGT